MPEQWNPLRLTTRHRFPVPLAIFVLAVYVAITLYVALHHEPWRDEADAWLAARDMTVSEMVPEWTARGGTPALWYLVVKALIRAGLPYLSQNVVNLLFIWAAAAVLLIAAPLTRLMKLLFVSSYFMAYEYAIIARSYSLTILLFFIAVALYPTRHTHPLRFALVVALLFNTNVHGAIIAATLLLLFAFPLTRGRAALTALAIMIGGGLLAYLQLRKPSGDSNPLVGREITVTKLLIAVRDAFLPASTAVWPAIIGALIIVTVAFAVRRSHPALLLLLGPLAALSGLFNLVWFGGLRHSGLILVIVIASIWLASEVPLTFVSAAAALLLNATLVASAAYAVSVSRIDVAFAFSGSAEMARFIDGRFEGHEIAAHTPYQAEALLPYLPGRRFWYIGLGQYGSFMNWTPAELRAAQMRYEAAVEAAKQHFARTRQPWLLLLNKRMPDPEGAGFRLLHAPSVVVFRNLDERYWLYEPVRSP